MTPARTDDRIPGLLAEGRRLLSEGRTRDAADAFGRVLLHDPGHLGAREGLNAARDAAAEERRRLDATLADARAAAAQGDAARARALLEEVVRLGGDRDEALALLDRLDRAAASSQAAQPAAQGAAATAAPDVEPRPRGGEPRRVLVAGWAAVFALLTLGAVSGWDELVAHLVRTPTPGLAAAPPATRYPAPGAGERALGDARERLERGDASGALAALAGVAPEDPAYPLVSQVRAQAERALVEQGRPR